jgi:hypothetical protein
MLPADHRLLKKVPVPASGNIMTPMLMARGPGAKLNMDPQSAKKAGNLNEIVEENEIQEEKKKQPSKNTTTVKNVLKGL